MLNIIFQKILKTVEMLEGSFCKSTNAVMLGNTDQIKHERTETHRHL